MPQALVWSETADHTILTMRADGATWLSIGKALGVSRNTAIERGRRLNAPAPPRFTPPRQLPEDPARPPLPAGHELTWGLISDDPYPR